MVSNIRTQLVNGSPWTNFAELEQWLRGHRQSAKTGPLLDLRVTEDGLELVAELPGFKAEDVELTIHREVLTLKGHREEPEAKRYFLRERPTGEFERSLRLPFPVDEAGVQASFENGLLTAKLPPRAEDQPRRIELNS